jgi:hypothetical protein
MMAGALAGSAVVLATHPIWTVNVSQKGGSFELTVANLYLI